MVFAKCTNPKCLYNWKSNSLMLRVSCPSCGNKVELRTEKENDGKK